MNLKRQWCDNPNCSDFGKIDYGNIKVYSHCERRFYCYTCRQSFSFDKGTFFETLRTKRQRLIDAIAMLVERNSLRAISRIVGCKPDTVLHWLDLSGQHAVRLNDLLIRNLHFNQIQVDEMYTFIKKRDYSHRS